MYKQRVGSCTVIAILSKLEKGEKEVMVKQALESAKLWEVRYEAVEKSRQEYRENTRKLVTENEGLHNAVHQVRWPEACF